MTALLTSLQKRWRKMLPITNVIQLLAQSPDETKRQRKPSGKKECSTPKFYNGKMLYAACAKHDPIWQFGQKSGKGSRHLALKLFQSLGFCDSHSWPRLMILRVKRNWGIVQQWEPTLSSPSQRLSDAEKNWGEIRSFSRTKKHNIIFGDCSIPSQFAHFWTKPSIELLQ